MVGLCYSPDFSCVTRHEENLLGLNTPEETILLKFLLPSSWYPTSFVFSGFCFVSRIVLRVFSDFLSVFSQVVHGVRCLKQPLSF